MCTLSSGTQGFQSLRLKLSAAPLPFLSVLLESLSHSSAPVCLENTAPFSSSLLHQSLGQPHLIKLLETWNSHSETCNDPL